MKRLLTIFSAAACLALVAARPAQAWHVSGFIYCDSNQNGRFDDQDLPLPNVGVVVESTDGTYLNGALSDGNGFYQVALTDIPMSYTATLYPSTLPSGTTNVLPASGTMSFSTTDTIAYVTGHWLISSPTCTERACWLTGGGGRFSTITNTLLAERGPQHNFGGNVNPSCSPDPGEGGNWNHIARDLKLHFQGTAIQVVACGNVPNIEPGSESPVTPFNFIEFKGTGTLKGIQGNKANFGQVYFFGRAEDRNEPGSGGAQAAVDIDRYFIRVYTDPLDPTGSTKVLVDADGNSATVDPVPITNGNLQIHVSSCLTPPQ